MVQCRCFDCGPWGTNYNKLYKFTTLLQLVIVYSLLCSHLSSRWIMIMHELLFCISSIMQYTEKHIPQGKEIYA